MRETFEPSLRLLLSPNREGGFVDDPRDNGGMTNLGVTKRAWEAYTGHMASEMQMRALTPAIVSPFYHKEYWAPVHADQLPAGLDHCVFDTAVNSGPGRAAKLLQQALGLTVDGVLGPVSLAAARKADAATVIASFSADRLHFLSQHEDWPRYHKGWERRVHEVEAEAVRFAAQQKTPLVS